jgi:fatty acid desaturase
MVPDRARAVDWPTFALIIACYGLWLLVLIFGWAAAPGLSVLALGVLIALHASLTHEVLHGHPFRSKRLNEALMLFSLNLMIPYGRFRDTHLAHHHDQTLTDPYDDPETNFLDPVRWARLPRWLRAVFAINNTLLGRMVIGPLLGQAIFMAGDWRLARAGDRAVIWAWVLHVPAVALVLALVIWAGVPVWAYLLAAWVGLAILKIRTFLEHRAHEKARARTVIIEDRGPLAFLFLNNNLHVVHHMHPQVPWYDLPRLYRANKDHYLRRNEGYVYRSYGEIFRQFLLRAKDPVPHPLWPRD